MRITDEVAEAMMLPVPKRITMTLETSIGGRETITVDRGHPAFARLFDVWRETLAALTEAGGAG